MGPEEIERVIEDGIESAEATVERTRGEHDDDHLRAEVVAEAFAGKTLLEQHDMVYDALGELMTNEIHALELSTRVPDED